MSRQFAFVASMIALASLCVPAIFPSSGHAAETCLAAPTQPAPQGSHWYYRLERATQRKCWRLVKLDQPPQSAAKQAAPQPAPADQEEVAPAAAAPAARVQSPQHGWLTRSASAVPETTAPAQGTPDRASEPADDQATAPPPVPGAQEQAIETVAPVQAAEPKQTTIAAQNPAAAAAGTGMTQFVFLAIAGIGLLAAAIFFIVDLRRRRSDVLTRIARDDITSFEAPEAEDAPTFSAMPPMRLTPQHDDVGEALRRRRRMAA